MIVDFITILYYPKSIYMYISLIYLQLYAYIDILDYSLITIK